MSSFDKLKPKKRKKMNVEIEEGLLSEAKALAKSQGITIRAIIEKSFEDFIAETRRIKS